MFGQPTSKKCETDPISPNLIISSSLRVISLLILLALLLSTAVAAPTIEIQGPPAKAAFKVVGWEGIDRLRPAAATLSADDWKRLFVVFVENDSPQSQVPPLLGSYRIEGDALVFEPRYPLQPGVRYRALFQPSPAETGGRSAPEVVTAIFDIPNRDVTPSTFVVNVYPTTSRLPENQLKFYLHFSAPMSRREAYRRVRLLDESGKTIELPFLEIDQELWDTEGKRLTLLFDPGRVKRELLPNREVGSPLREGSRYTLVIDEGWPDAKGLRLKGEFRKPFEVGPPDHDPPDPQSWTITAPKAATREALVVEFPEPMDQALLSRVVTVTTTVGTVLSGSVKIDRHETRWQFTPSEPWKPAPYFLTAETILEDLAGNMIGRPFEVDNFERVEERVVRETVQLRFSPTERAKAREPR